MTDFSAMTDKNNEKIDKNKEEPGGLRVKPINNGTVIDHIAGGQALNVLKILGISGTTGATVSVVMNVESKKLGKKDIVKVEDRELREEELNRIALIPVDLPDEIVGVVRCQNPNCISNTHEPIKSRMLVKAKNPVLLRCLYCEQPLANGIAEYLI